MNLYKFFYSIILITSINSMEALNNNLENSNDSFDAIKYIENLVTGTKEYSPEICGELCDIVHNSIEEIISTSLYHRRSKDDLDINFDNEKQPDNRLNKSTIYDSKLTLDSQYINVDKLQNILQDKTTYYIFRSLISDLDGTITANATFIKSYLMYCKPLYNNIFSIANHNIYTLDNPDFDFYIGLKKCSRYGAHLKLSIIFSTYLSLEAARVGIKLFDSISHKLIDNIYKQNLYKSSLFVEINSDNILRNQYQKLIEKIKRYNKMD